MTVGVSANKDRFHVCKNVVDAVVFATNSRDFDQNVGNAFFARINVSVIVSVVENVSGKRRRTDFFEVVVGRCGVTKRNENLADNICIAIGVVKHVSGLLAVDVSCHCTNVNEAIGLSLNQSISPRQQVEVFAEFVVTVGVGRC